MTGRAGVVALVAGVLFGSACAPALVQSQEVWLLTEGEAALALAPLTRAAELPKNGPLIKIVTPQQAAEVISPFPVEIRFEPRPGGAPVKMDTLKLTVLRVFEIDITDRIRPYIGESKLAVKEAKMPSGHYRLKLLIADAAGRQSGEILEVTVK